MFRRTITLLTAVLVATTLVACDIKPSGPREPSPTDFFTVNTLPYAYTVLGPVDQAYRVVAAHRGWSQADIDAWAPFVVYDVIAKESGGCFNVRRGARMAESGVSCKIARQGHGSDSGFGQVISIHYRGWLCRQERLCSSHDITLNAWNSMTAVLALVERSGRQPWCYNDFARRYHPGCATAPRNAPVPSSTM